MKRARDVMDPNPLVVSPDLPVADLARLLLESNAPGACVMEAGRLVGVVTAMDLIFQERKVHLPSFILFMDAVIPVGERRTRRELEQITGGRVRAIMSPDPRTASPDEPMDAIATLMVDHHISLVPVLDGTKLVGQITQTALLRALFGTKQEPGGA